MEDGKHIGAYDAGIFWHTDGAYLANPHAISALRALEVPEQDGRVLGDTVFASMSAAYDALSASMKKQARRPAGAAQHHLPPPEDADSGVKKEYNAAVKADPEAVHPVVRVHPVTGRKCLYVSEGYTVKILGLPEDESKDLIAELVAPLHQAANSSTATTGAQHDLVMWDDCSTQHKATFDYALPLRRRMHRTTVINGCESVMPQAREHKEEARLRRHSSTGCDATLPAAHLARRRRVLQVFQGVAGMRGSALRVVGAKPAARCLRRSHRPPRPHPHSAPPGVRRIRRSCA